MPADAGSSVDAAANLLLIRLGPGRHEAVLSRFVLVLRVLALTVFAVRAKARYPLSCVEQSRRVLSAVKLCRGVSLRFRRADVPAQVLVPRQPVIIWLLAHISSRALHDLGRKGTGKPAPQWPPEVLVAGRG
jgi:hypothetical protein